jgi:pyruvate kinase
MKNDLKLMVTLWPSFPHFKSFLNDDRLSGIRLNSAMMALTELDRELSIVKREQGTRTVPLFYDIKGRQLRIEEVIPNPDHLEIRLNHPITVNTPTPVLFKAGADAALLESIEDDGYRLVFEGGPKYVVRAGESLHIRHPSLCVGGNQFTDAELSKIDRVRKSGFTKWFLSYVESQRDIDEFRELVGKDADVMLKIESKKGLEYVEREFKKQDNLTLVVARGDLYVELLMPHEILAAQKMLIEKDPKACVASRLLLSIVRSPVPSCTDFSELAWLYDIGYRNIMLCDELCLKEEFLGPAVSAFDAFRDSYTTKNSAPVVSMPTSPRSSWRKMWDRLGI